MRNQQQQTEPTILIVNGFHAKQLPVQMLKGYTEKIPQLLKCTFDELPKRGILLAEIIKIFRGPRLKNVSVEKLDYLVATWIAVWRKHGQF